jgi:hypothetical protein
MTPIIRILALLAAVCGALIVVLAGFQVMASFGGQEADAWVAWIGLGFFGGLFLVANAVAFRCLGLTGRVSLLKVCIGLNSLLVLLSAAFLGLTVAYREVLHAYYLAIPLWSFVVIWACWRRLRRVEFSEK